MKQKYPILFLITFIFTLSCQTHESDKPDTPTEPFEPYANKEWNIMVYQAADNNLDADIFSDLKEIVASGFDRSRIRVVVLLDKWLSFYGSWKDTRLYNIQFPDTPLDSMEIESLTLGLSIAGIEELDMGDPATLEKFVRFVKETFPAQKNALIMASHGSGWVIRRSKSQAISQPYSNIEPELLRPSVVEDYTSGSTLNIGEIKAALQNNNHVDILGFDACVMANIEVAYELKDIADYMVFSQDYEPSEGWDYTSFLNLFSQGELSSSRLITSIIDTYSNFCRRWNITDYTLSAVDCKKVQEFVQNRIPELVTGLTENFSHTEIINAMEAATRVYYPFSDTLHKNGSYYLDLYSFINQLSWADSDLKTRLLASLADLTVYKKNADKYSQAGSISIFLPFVDYCFSGSEPAILNAVLLNDLTNYTQTDFAHAGTPNWQAMLDYLYAPYLPN